MGLLRLLTKVTSDEFLVTATVELNSPDKSTFYFTSDSILGFELEPLFNFYIQVSYWFFFFYVIIDAIDKSFVNFESIWGCKSSGRSFNFSNSFIFD